jgi:hypothetical protein
MANNLFSRGCLISAISVGLTLSGCYQTANSNQGTGTQLGAVAGSSNTEHHAAGEKVTTKASESHGFRLSNIRTPGGAALIAVGCVIDLFLCPMLAINEVAQVSKTGNLEEESAAQAAIDAAGEATSKRQSLTNNPRVGSSSK